MVEINGGSVGGAAVMYSHALPQCLESAVAGDGPLLGAGSVAGEYLHWGEVRRAPAPDVHAHPLQAGDRGPTRGPALPGPWPRHTAIPPVPGPNAPASTA